MEAQAVDAGLIVQQVGHRERGTQHLQPTVFLVGAGKMHQQPGPRKRSHGGGVHPAHPFRHGGSLRQFGRTHLRRQADLVVQVERQQVVLHVVLFGCGQLHCRHVVRGGLRGKTQSEHRHAQPRNAQQRDQRQGDARPTYAFG